MDGFRGPRKGRSEPMVLSEKTLYSLGRRCVYIFNRWKAKKEIPAPMPTILPSVSDMTRVLGCSILLATAAAAQVYTIETIAGGGDGVGDDGPAIRAKLTEPTGVAVDAAGNIYIADRHNHRVRKVDTSGTISTFAGTSVGTRDYGFNGDGGPADRALLAFPEGVVVDAVGNVYIADTDNHRIRMVDASGIIHTIAGSGERGFDGDDGPAISALLSEPSGVAVDAVGNLYIADSRNNRIRKVDASGIIHTIAGTGVGGATREGGLAVESDLFRPLDLGLSMWRWTVLAIYTSRTSPASSRSTSRV